MSFTKKVLVTAAALLVTGTVLAKDFTVGFSNRTMNGPYFNALTENVKEMVQSQGWKVIATDARGDLNKQVADVEDMVSKGVDFLILNPQDPVAGKKIVKQVRAKNIPVLIIDSDLEVSPDVDVLTRIAPDNVHNNLLIGEFAAKQLGDKPINLAVISGNQGNLVGQTRSTNFYLGIINAQLRASAKTGFNIVSQVWGGWDQQGGLKAMEDVLVAHPEVNAVYAENDDMALGAIRALKAANKLNSVKVYSYDGNKNAYKSIIDGEMQATGENNPKIMATMAVDVIKKNLANPATRFPDYSLCPVLMVTKDNATKVYDAKSLF